MEPYYQGALDSLCGVYSIVNAVIKVTKSDNSEELFKNTINFLYEEKDLAKILVTDGISRQSISGIFKNVIKDQVCVSTPFWNKPETKLDNFWQEMMGFLEEDEERAILIGLRGKVWDHWSVIESLSEKQLRFADSYTLQHMNRNRCTTQTGTKNRPHVIYPTHTYFISK